MRTFTLSVIKILLFITAVTIVIALLVLPSLEGRAEGLSPIEIYSDPLVIYSFLSLVPFFFGVFEAYRFLNLLSLEKAPSKETDNILRNIQLAAGSLIVLLLGALVYIRLFAHGDDPAGPSMLGGIIIIFLGIVIAFCRAFQQRTEKR